MFFNLKYYTLHDDEGRSLPSSAHRSGLGKLTSPPPASNSVLGAAATLRPPVCGYLACFRQVRPRPRHACADGSPQGSDLVLN